MHGELTRDALTNVRISALALFCFCSYFLLTFLYLRVLLKFVLTKCIFIYCRNFRQMGGGGGEGGVNKTLKILNG